MQVTSARRFRLKERLTHIHNLYLLHQSDEIVFAKNLCLTDIMGDDYDRSSESDDN